MDPQPNPDSQNRGSMLSLMIAALFGGGFLIFLILITGGFFLWVVLAVGAMGLFGLLHYVLWGEALTEEVAAERAAQEAQQRRDDARARQEYPHGIRRL